ncbi:MAG: hypothetical protein IAG13_15645, partial [Deltaproteobacteria bacterium]|nr:hypothetical protein [Nannocystaceae bacterium]
SIDDLLKLEFLDDETGEIGLVQSFFVVAEADLVRVGAEYRLVSDTTPSDAGPDYVCFSELPVDVEVVVCPTTPHKFHFASDAHRDFRFTTLDALRDYVREKCVRPLQKMPKRAVLDHAAERLEANDEEWIAAVDKSRHRDAWLRKCGEQRARREEAAGKG